MVDDRPKGIVIVSCGNTDPTILDRLHRLIALSEDDVCIHTLPFRLPSDSHPRALESRETLNLVVKELNNKPPRMNFGRISRNPHPLPSVPKRGRKKT